MHDLPRQKLTEIVAKYGRALCDDPRRCEALLRDFCGQYRGEIHALVGALKDRVAADLLASKDAVPHGILLVRLAKRLCEHRALSQLAARWAVHSWALALGVLSSEELQSLAPSAEPDWGAWCQLRTFEGHTDSVGSVVFSPDGAILASGSGDRTIRLWRVSDGQSVRQLEGHTSSVWSVAFSPDGAALASGSEDKTVRLWRVSDGQSVRQLEGHTSSVWSVAFSPDGATLASGSSDKTIRLWRVADGQPLRTLEGHTDWVRSVAFSPDGATVASGSDDKTIRLWRVSDGKPPRTIPGQTGTASAGQTANETKRVVTAKYPNHVWHVDLTAVSILGGFWTSWLPFALPQCWPFCWWVAVAIDHYSRRCMGIAVFRTAATSEAVCAFLRRAIHSAGRAPRYIVCDKGPQFWCPGFKRWCKRHKIKPPRFGAVGQHGSIAVIEFILTMKTLCTRVMLVPLRREKIREELSRFAGWYNGHRPHMTLKGSTPDEVYHRQHPTCRYPRLEPRGHWPRASPCAQPRVPIRGWPGQRLELNVEFHAGRKHLPIVTLRRAA
jgi:transposase InsO family protein